MDDKVEQIKKTVVYILPGTIVAVSGCALMLAIAVFIVTDGAQFLRSFTSDLPAAARAVILFSVLGGSLTLLAYAGRRAMGYIITLTGTSGENRK